MNENPSNITGLTCDTSELPAPTNGYKLGCSTPLVNVGTGCLLGCNPGLAPRYLTYITCEDHGQGMGSWSNSAFLHCTGKLTLFLMLP